MGFDEEAYVRQVLEPARRDDSRPPDDLLTRYQLTLPLSSAEVDATLPAVLACWRKSRRELKFRKLVARLEAEHATLTSAFERARTGDVSHLRTAVTKATSRSAARLQRLASDVEDLAGPVRRMTPRLVDELAAHHGLQSAQVTSLLARRGITVTAPDALPRQPPLGAYRRCREALRTLGCRHPADFLFDHGAPGGARGPSDSPADTRLTLWPAVTIAGHPDREVTVEAVRAADQAWAARPHDGSKTLANTVLVALKGVLTRQGPAGIADLVRYEVAEELRMRHRLGASAAALVHHAITGLGLVEGDARRIAFAVRAEPTQHEPPAEPPPAEPPPAEQPGRASPASTPRSAAPGKAISATRHVSTAGEAIPAEPGIDESLSAGTPTLRWAPDQRATPPNSHPPPAAPTGGAARPATREPAPEAWGEGVPVPALAGVSVDRAGNEAAVRWQWPTELTEVAVRWRVGGGAWREKRFSRGAYRSQGAAWLPLVSPAERAGDTPLEVVLVPIAPRDGRRARGVPVTVRTPGRVEAWYEVARAGPPWRRKLAVEMRAGQRATLRHVMVVLRRGAVMPLHGQDGEVLQEWRHVTLGPEQPLRLTLTAPRGPYWLRCFVTDDSVELRDPPVGQLRGR